LLAAQPASLLGGQIYGDLLTLERQIRELNQRLESLENTLDESGKLIADLEKIQTERDKLLAELQALLDKREWTLKQLGTLVEDQKTLYQKSLWKWKFSTIVLGILSAALTGMVIYQGATK
jgi:chromosome segregation ATPase